MILLDETSWEIKTTKKKGHGLFAKKEIAPGTVIGDYIGKVIKTAEEDTSDKNGLYLLYYHDYASIYPEDLKTPGIHMANHSCAPNCWVSTYKGHTLFFALRKIFPGEELTISYLLSPDDYCDPCTHACLCESDFCLKTMHLNKAQFKAWNAFHESEAKETKRAAIRYGKLLPKLKSYPKTIADHPVYTLFGSSAQPAMYYQETMIPSLQEVRNRIRITGKTLRFPDLHIYGVREGKFITK